MQQTTLFGYPIHLVDAVSGLEVLETALDEGRNIQVVTINPEIIMQADEDPEFAAIIRRAGLVIPDGAGVVWALRKRGHTINRLPGIEFSEAILAKAAEKNYRVAVIGAREEVLPQAVNALKAKFNGLKIVYSHSGFFESSDDETRVAEECAVMKPQVLLLALGVPRQEKWIARYEHLFTGCALIGVGGSLDVWSGNVPRAPEVMRALNLEWLYRISREPWRIKRIYKSLPMFVVKVLTTKSS